MAMGGGSYNNSSNNNKGNGRVRMLLLMAFGAALLGVMVVHKLRERRIFHLLVSEKDRDLLSLHLLLQKERDLGQEMTRKNEEMRGKILALTTHKAELDTRLSEMRSTIAFLKDEQRSVAVALEEKQSEIKMLRDKEGDSQLRLKQREAEVEDLRSRLGVPLANVNGTVAPSETEQDGESSQSASVPGSQNATGVEDKESVAEGEGNNKAQPGGAFANVTEMRNEVGELNGEILQKTDGDSKIQDESGNGSVSRAKGSRGKGRRYSRHRRSEKNGDADNDGARNARRLRSRRLYKDVPKIEINKPQGDDQIVLKTRTELDSEDKKPEIPDLRQVHELPTRRDDEEGHVLRKQEVHSPEAENQNPEATENTKDQEAENQNPEETEHAKDQVASTDGELQVKEEGETTKISGPRDGEASAEVSPEKDAEEVKVGEEQEDEEDTEITDKKEEKTDTATDDFFREPRSNSDEDSEEYKEETDESEF